jgi:hypothetical protein
MKLHLALVVLIAAAAPAAAQTVICPYGQTCNGGTAVPFPVINPVQGLSNVLTAPLRQNQPAQQQLPYGYTAPIATPPATLPPGTSP